MIVFKVLPGRVVNQQTGIVCADIQQSVGGLIQGVYIGGLYRERYVPVFAGCFLQQV